MDSRRATQIWNENPGSAISKSDARLAEKLAELEQCRPLCACGCGDRLAIPTIVKNTTVQYIKRYWDKHPTRQNHYKVSSAAERLAELESIRPFCVCGCGELLNVPMHKLKQSSPATVEAIRKHWERHSYKQGHGTWERRTSNYISGFETLSPKIVGLIYGTLLGDCAISYPNRHSRFPRLAWTHGELQQEWSQCKAEHLSVLRPKLRMSINRGFGQLSSCCQTACHPELLPIFETVRPGGGQKQVSINWLEFITPEG